MKALVKYGQQDGQVELRNVPEPEIGPNDVLLEVKSAGICGWDIEMWRHRMASPVKIPVIQGHEFAGIIRSIGSSVQDFEEGDRVVSETAAVICGKCSQCRTGNYNICPDRKGFGYGVDGAFTDLVCVPQRCLHFIPENVTFDHAALTEPACVAYHSLVIQSEVKPGEPIIIIGPGPIGLFCLQVAKACGSNPIIIVGTDKDMGRLALAEKLGADIVINVSSQNPMEIVSDITSGQGVPLVIDAAGNEKALALAIEAVAKLGQITKIGWGPKPINMSLDPLLSKSVRLQGTFSHNWPDWEAVLKMISQKTLQMEPMITHRVNLDQWLETFEAIENCQEIKAIFQINKT